MGELGKKVDFAISLLKTAEEETKRRPTNREGGNQLIMWRLVALVARIASVFCILRRCLASTTSLSTRLLV